MAVSDRPVVLTVMRDESGPVPPNFLLMTEEADTEEARAW